MKNNHGTTFTLSQFATINSAITRALPKALQNLDPKTLLNAVSGHGDVLERELAKMLYKFCEGQGTDTAFPAMLPPDAEYIRVIPEANECFIDGCNGREGFGEEGKTFYTITADVKNWKLDEPTDPSPRTKVQIADLEAISKRI